jgi:hypothetical protein
MAVNEASKKQNIFGFYQNKAKLNSSYWPWLAGNVAEAERARVAVGRAHMGLSVPPTPHGKPFNIVSCLYLHFKNNLKFFIFFSLN